MILALAAISQLINAGWVLQGDWKVLGETNYPMELYDRGRERSAISLQQLLVVI